MSDKPYDIAIVLGRFQPLHIGHINLINQSFTLADKTFVMVGHSGFTDIRHFIEPAEVEKILNKTYEKDENYKNLYIEHISDMYDDGKWVLKLSQKIEMLKLKYTNIKGSVNICFLGSKKDINWYANLLPNWTLITLPPYKKITATDIRGAFLCNGKISEDTSEEAKKYMENFKNNSLEDYQLLAKKYKQYYSIID